MLYTSLELVSSMTPFGEMTFFSGSVDIVSCVTKFPAALNQKDTHHIFHSDENLDSPSIYPHSRPKEFAHSPPIFVIIQPPTRFLCAQCRALGSASPPVNNPMPMMMPSVINTILPAYPPPKSQNQNNSNVGTRGGQVASTFLSVIDRGLPNCVMRGTHCDSIANWKRRFHHV